MVVLGLIPDAILDAFQNTPLDPIGIAVSGGGDSMALLHLAHQYATEIDRRIVVATVDHGLRPEARSEAEMVARFCVERAIPHDILKWSACVSGNLQAAARAARYDLLAAWIKPLGGNTVFLGHTADDVAETFLMRLARGSGVDGLAAMTPIREDRGVIWRRPLLDHSRKSLRDVLLSAGIAWVDDPSNADKRFQRVKARDALKVLETLGLTPDRLRQTAAHMGKAQAVLEAQTQAALTSAVTVHPIGLITLAQTVFVTLPDEIQGRVLSQILSAINGNAYRPRLADLSRLQNSIVAGSAARTLTGVEIRCKNNVVYFTREAAAVSGPMVHNGTSAVWDHRWTIVHNLGAVTVAALGESGLAQCDWRASGVDRKAALVAPGLWDGPILRAAPLIKDQKGVIARLNYVGLMNAMH